MTRSTSGIVAEARKREVLLNGGFWKRVDMTAGPEGCWPWMGSRKTDPTGLTYGFITAAGRRVYVHRRVVELALGRSLEPGEVAMHHCDNRPCCNPAHLYEGTAQTNSDDAHARGRAANLLGTSRPDVTRRHIRRMHSEGRESAIEITDAIASWRELDAIAASDAMTALGGRLAHGGRLPDWVA